MIHCQNVVASQRVRPEVGAPHGARDGDPGWPDEKLREVIQSAF